MAFNKRRWQGSVFQRKVDETRKDDGVTWGNLTLRMIVVEIGSWDMNVSAAGSNLASILHGLDITKIRSISALIIDDNQSHRYPLDYYNINTGVVAGGLGMGDTTTISLRAETGGIFDDGDHNDTTINRGWVTIWYEG